MKLKRFLCLAVSLAMVLSMVPALALTASAAVDASWIGNDTLVYDGTQSDTAYGQGEKYIAVEFTLGTVSGYKDLAMTDADGKKIAGFCDAWLSNDGFYVPDGERSAAADNTVVSTSGGNIKYNDYSGNAIVRALIENTGSQYTVEYSVVDAVGGSVVNTFATMVYSGTANGISLPAYWNYNGWGSGVSASNADSAFSNFTVFAYTPDTLVNVTATYKINGEAIKTVNSSYDTANGEDSVTFDAYTYSENGTNYIYTADAVTVSEDVEIDMTALANPDVSGYELGKVFAHEGVQYEVKSGNLIPNGDFSYGTAGWYNGTGSEITTEFTVADNELTAATNGGTASAGALYRAWSVTSGTTYLLTFESTTAVEWSSIGTMGAPLTRGSYVTTLKAGSGGTYLAEGTNQYIFTADKDAAYVGLNFGWHVGAVYSNFGLYEIAEAKVHVTEEIESVANIADVAVFGNDTVVLPETVAVTGNLGSNVNAPIEWVEPEVYEGTTTVAGKATVQFGDQAAEEIDVAVNVTIIDEFTIEDFTSVNGQTAGKSNQKVFPVAIRGAFTMTFTANYASFGDLFITIKTANAGFFGPEQIALGSNASAGFRPVNGNGTGGRAANDATLATFTAGKDYGFIVKADASTDKYTVIVYDAATGVVVATAENFGFRTNADAIEAITALTNNGAGSVTLTNIKVDTSDVDVCTVTVDGVEKNVVKGQSYAQVLEGAALVDETGNVYVPVDNVVTIPVDGDMNLTTVALGLEMVSGAQVRIGTPELVEGKLDATADSGLRFLAKANTTDTLLAIADEYGIKVTAEGSDYAAYVKAEKFQDESVFSAAITGLSESNYNRNYTAVGYAIVNGAEITTTDSVTRSIYQVSAGIMNYGKADAEDEAYSVNGIVKDVLNAYLNQTGIRLTVTEDGITVEEGKYTGDVFFIVDCVSDGDDGWNVTITPDTTWGTPAEIASWWTEYVRFNNNNSVAKGYISGAAISGDGVLTFNFDTTDDSTGEFDGPWVSIS